jgi:hypothetical protein
MGGGEKWKSTTSVTILRESSERILFFVRYSTCVPLAPGRKEVQNLRTLKCLGLREKVLNLSCEPSSSHEVVFTSRSGVEQTYLEPNLCFAQATNKVLVKQKQSQHWTKVGHGALETCGRCQFGTSRTPVLGRSFTPGQDGCGAGPPSPFTGRMKKNPPGERLSLPTLRQEP